VDAVRPRSKGSFEIASEHDILLGSEVELERRVLVHAPAKARPRAGEKLERGARCMPRHRIRGATHRGEALCPTLDALLQWAAQRPNERAARGIT
jgi:hypothetical protein